MKLNTLQDLFLEELKDMYSGESLIIKALPKIARQATSDDLKAALEEHLVQTRGHKERLEKIFEDLGQKAKTKLCKGLQGILEEGEELLKEDAEDAVLDAAIIAGAQKVEHYEMAAYGTLRSYADMLGLEDASRLLAQTLEEEKAADVKLTEIAEAHINRMAATGESEEEEEHPDVAEVGSHRRVARVVLGDEDEDEDFEETAMVAEEEEETEDAEEGVYTRGKGPQPPRRGAPTRRLRNREDA